MVGISKTFTLTNLPMRVFEHEKLTLRSDKMGRRLTQAQLDSLIIFNTENNNKYFTVIHNGVKFSQYVGVIQVGKLTIEILPKADKISTTDDNDYLLWRNVLLDMLCISNRISVDAIHEANLKKRHNSILDLYFSIFVSQLEVLVRRGLFKEYKSNSSNLPALKGKLNFSKNIQYNIVRKDRFYTDHQVYSYDHRVNQVLSKALEAIESLSVNQQILDKVKQLKSLFPEQQSIVIQESTFTKIRISRKLIPYQEILKIAEIILLNYSPEIKSGGTKLLALLFDMNKLWESFIYLMLTKVQDDNFRVKGQQSRKFWNDRTVRPDIIIEYNDQVFVIDTKWKVVESDKASDSDLKQLYVYNMYWDAPISILLYPGNNKKDSIVGTYHKGQPNKQTINKCILSFISVIDEKNKLDRNIGQKIKSLVSESAYKRTPSLDYLPTTLH
ncbi:MAG: 5-methylcytosine-specific restriction enzyme subunit McrC [Halioglobus sp.]|jgi:5-methylcytosine-specific restriction enzyme subunit McrC